jgi:hypothetical protein
MILGHLHRGNEQYMNLVWHYEVLPQWWPAWRGRSQVGSHDTNGTLHGVAYICILCCVVDLLRHQMPTMLVVVQILVEVVLVLGVGGVDD